MKLIVIIMISLISGIDVFGEDSQGLTDYAKGRKYLEADLAVIGIIDSLEKHKIQTIEIKGSDNWKVNNNIYFDKCYFRVESVIKGTLSDSILNFKSENYSDIPSKSKFSHVNQSGDSVFSGIVNIDFGPHSSGLKANTKYLILFKVGKDRLTPTFVEENYEKTALLFREVENKGIKHLIPCETDSTQK